LVPLKSLTDKFVRLVCLAFVAFFFSCVTAAKPPVKTAGTELGLRIFSAAANRGLPTPLEAGPAGSVAFDCRTLSSMVMIYSDGPPWSAAFGSGFLVGDGRYMLTAYHVIEGRSRVRVARLFCASGSDRKLLHSGYFPVRIIAWNDGRDVAILEVEGDRPFGQPLPVTLELPPIDAPIWHYGVTSIVESGKLDEWPSMTLPGQAVVRGTARPGDSGGPVLDEKGRVIGVTVARVLDEDTDYYLFISINDIASGLLWEPE
jgi:S1-C subfamily serine protease